MVLTPLGLNHGFAVLAVKPGTEHVLHVVGAHVLLDLLVDVCLLHAASSLIHVVLIWLFTRIQLGCVLRAHLRRKAVSRNTRLVHNVDFKMGWVDERPSLVTGHHVVRGVASLQVDRRNYHFGSGSCCLVGDEEVSSKVGSISSAHTRATFCTLRHVSWSVFVEYRLIIDV